MHLFEDQTKSMSNPGMLHDFGALLRSLLVTWFNSRRRKYFCTISSDFLAITHSGGACLFCVHQQLVHHERQAKCDTECRTIARACEDVSAITNDQTPACAFYGCDCSICIGMTTRIAINMPRFEICSFQHVRNMRKRMLKAVAVC